MPSETTPLLSQCPARGVYAPSKPTDSRSPCPLLNCLANHGYLPRDGKNISGDQFAAALGQAGIASTLAAVLARPIYVKYEDPKTAYLRKPRSFFGKIWYYICNPWAFVLGGYALWKGDRAGGKRVMDLDRLALYGVAEHDISMTRRDYLESAGNNALQEDLVNDLLASSKDGKVITLEDMAEFRKKRIQTQLEANPSCYYGPWEHQTACSNIALILHSLGDGKSVRCDYLKAFLLEERLPIKEGWKRRWWWPLGVLELGSAASKIKSVIGLKV